MTIDSDGYGYAPDDRGVSRLLEDLRTLSPAGVERAASGMANLNANEHHAFHEGERAALAALEAAEKAEGWQDLHRSLFSMTEGKAAMVAWQAEHGDVGSAAETAAYGAALAVYGREVIDPKAYDDLVRPMSEALPWLKQESS